MSELDPNVIVSAMAVSLLGSVFAYLRGKAKASKVADWAELADAACEAAFDDIERAIVAAGIRSELTAEDARPLFESAIYASLAVLGVKRAQAKPIVELAAEHGVQALRKRLGAIAAKRVAVLLPALADATTSAVGAFTAKPVVNVRPEDVRMELVPFESSSATTEPASQGSPPLPPAGPSGPKE